LTPSAESDFQQRIS
jgi:hypothetical protein